MEREAAQFALPAGERVQVSTASSKVHTDTRHDERGARRSLKTLSPCINIASVRVM
jgi:hypothetical protein